MNDSQTLPFRNSILSSLPPEEINRLRPHLARVRLVRGQDLQDAGERVSQVFFIEEGLASVTTPSQGTREPVEVALVGRNGMSGLITLLGEDVIAFNCVTMQLPGYAYRASADALHECLQASPMLDRSLRRALEIYIAQLSQSVACATQHTVPQRLARWLLMALDRLDGSELVLTQDFLAVMLGVRRPGVTLALGHFQDGGLVTHSRGRLQVKNRGALEATACSCYHRLCDFTHAVSAKL